MHGINCVLRVSFIGLIFSDIVLGKYTDYWAVHIEGGEEVAQSIAAKHGFVYRGQVRDRNCRLLQKLLNTRFGVFLFFWGGWFFFFLFSFAVYA